MFLSGIVVGAVGLLGMSALLAGARRSAVRGRDARRDLARSQRKPAVVKRQPTQELEHQDGADTDSTVNSTAAKPRRHGLPLLGHWARRRQTVDASHVDSLGKQRGRLSLSPPSRSVTRALRSAVCSDRRIRLPLGAKPFSSLILAQDQHRRRSAALRGPLSTGRCRNQSRQATPAGCSVEDVGNLNQSGMRPAVRRCSHRAVARAEPSGDNRILGDHHDCSAPSASTETGSCTILSDRKRLMPAQD